MNRFFVRKTVERNSEYVSILTNKKYTCGRNMPSLFAGKHCHSFDTFCAAFSLCTQVRSSIFSLLFRGPWLDFSSTQTCSLHFDSDDALENFVGDVENAHSHFQWANFKL